MLAQALLSRKDARMRGQWRIAVVEFGSPDARFFGTVAEAEDFCEANNIDKGQISKWWVSGSRYKAQILISLQSTGFIIPNFLRRP
jgi:hypothetical protein